MATTTLYEELHELGIRQLRLLGRDLAIPHAWSLSKEKLVEAIIAKSESRNPLLTQHMHWGDWYVAGVIVR